MHYGLIIIIIYFIFYKFEFILKFSESELVDELFVDDDTVNEFIWDCISIEFIDILVFCDGVIFEL